MLATFQAHHSAVVAQLPVGRHELLTVAADTTATLWDLRGAQPRAVATVRGLPDYRGGLHAANVKALHFDQGGLLLLAANGHKVAATHVPPRATAQAPYASQAHKRHFVDDRGNRIHRHHLAIESLAVLPMRRMLLLGCEDGHVRVTA